MFPRTATLALALVAATTSIASAQRARSCVPADTKLDWVRWPTEETSPPKSEIVALERRLQTAPETSIPAVLLQLGRLKSRLAVDSTYAKGHPDEFFYQEFAGNWLYTGWHFQELLKRFPQSHFADDAAYELTLLPEGVECEGYLPCQVNSLWMRVGTFLRAYPSSPMADSAVQRALLAFSTIKPNMDLVRGSDLIDPPELRKLVGELEAVALTLPRRQSIVLLTRVAELREQLGDYSASRTLFRTVVDVQEGRVSACAVAHLRRLEDRLARP